MHQTISCTRAALTSVIGGPLSDFHSLIKSNIWYLRGESARDPKRPFRVARSNAAHVMMRPLPLPSGEYGAIEW